MISKGQVIEVVDTYDVVSHIQRIGCQPEQLLYPVAIPARALLIRGKKEIEKTGSPPPPSCAARSEKIDRKSRHASTCLGATQVSVRLASAQGFLRLVACANWYRFARFYASVCDDNFTSLYASLFFWRCLAARLSLLSSTRP